MIVILLSGAQSSNGVEMARKKALVTGGSEGIGRTFIQHLLKQDFDVTAVARNEERLKELKCDYLVADLTTHDGLAETNRKVASENYDLMINNAGFGAFGTFTDIELDRHLKMLKLNIDALTALSHIFLKNAKPGDALINVASTAGFQALPYTAAYAATKAYVISLSHSLWYEQKAKGIYVQALCPGFTRTEFGKRAGLDDSNPAFAKFEATSDEVVAISLKELKKRKNPLVITGAQNKISTQIQRFVPRSAVVFSVGRAFEKFLKGSLGASLGGPRNTA